MPPQLKPGVRLLIDRRRGNRTVKRILVVIAIAVGVLAMAGPVEACVCGVAYNPTRDQRLSEVRRIFDWADIVFTGEVVSTDRTSGTLVVDKMWKGVPLERVRMRHSIELPNGNFQINSCTKAFSSGKHVVFGKQVAPGLWEAGTCGPNGKFDPGSEVLEFLDELCRTVMKCIARGGTGLEVPGAWLKATQPNIALHQTAARAIVRRRW
jgi:hypothetical protein